MQQPVTVNYVRNKRGWKVTLEYRGQRRSIVTTSAAGILAARNRADQLVEQLESQENQQHTVLHLLDGDAYAFTSSYLHARFGFANPRPPAVPAEKSKPLASVAKNAPIRQASPKS
jgi:phospholipase/lecithinase/hemolysin